MGSVGDFFGDVIDTGGDILGGVGDVIGDVAGGIGDLVGDLDLGDALQAFVMSGGNPYAAAIAATGVDESLGFNPGSFMSGDFSSFGGGDLGGIGGGGFDLSVPDFGGLGDLGRRFRFCVGTSRGLVLDLCAFVFRCGLFCREEGLLDQQCAKFEFDPLKTHTSDEKTGKKKAAIW